MFDPLLFYGVLFVVVAPAATLIHELGHAAAALVMTDQHVSVQLGSRPSNRPLRLGRLTLHLKLLTFVTGFCRYGREHPIPPLRHLWIRLAGPAASAAAFGALAAVHLIVDPGLVLWRKFGPAASWFFLIQAVVTLAPITYPRWLPGYAGYKSDGLMALRYWSRRRADEQAA